MERDVNYIIVGVSVVALVAAFFGFIVWQAGTYDTRTFDRYGIHFEEAVSGLKEGSTVHYRGVEVGRVIAIRLQRDRPDLIRVDIEVDKNTPVTRNTMAQLKPQGITGLSFIELRTDASKEGPPDIPDGERYPVIVAQPSQLDKLFKDLPEVAAQLIEISERVEAMLSEQNIESFSRTLANTADLTENLNGLTADMKTLMTRAEQTIGGIDMTVAKSRAMLGEAHADMMPKLDATLAHLESLSGRLDHITQQSEASLARASGKGLDELTYLLEDTRRMVAEVEALSKNLNEEPTRLLFKSNYQGVEIQP